VTAASFESGIEASDVLEAHDVLADEPGIGKGLTCRWPADREPVGLVLFCHGLGSSGQGYRDLARHWARHGYVVVQPTFADAIGRVASGEPKLGLDPEADLSGWAQMPAVRARMHEILHAPEHWLERIATTNAVMDRRDSVLEATCGRPPAPLPCAVAGHSFGAYTAQLLAGAEIDLPGGRAHRFRDDRFRAAILLSAQGRDQQGLRDGSWDAMDGPVLTVTGTLDRGAKGGDWRWKSEPFELAPNGDKYLAVLDEGDHYLGGFADNGLQPQVPAQQEAVRQLTLAFLDAHVGDRRAARDWLGSVDGQLGGCRLSFRRR
jgi:predicted dienelactone hydrolase